MLRNGATETEFFPRPQDPLGLENSVSLNVVHFLFLRIRFTHHVSHS